MTAVLHWKQGLLCDKLLSDRNIEIMASLQMTPKRDASMDSNKDKKKIKMENMFRYFLCTSKAFFNPFQNKSRFLRVYSTSLLKTLLEKEK